MKTLRFIGMAIIAVIVSIQFAACSDDSESIEDAIVGTWKVTTNDENLATSTFTFMKGGGFVWNNGQEISSNCSYTLSNNKLKIIFNQDDYIEGTIAINGNSATYHYMWYDVDGEWGGEKSYSLTLQKQ